MAAGVDHGVIDRKGMNMSDMDHAQANHTLLGMIEIISSNRDSGRLEIAAAATTGAFFFKEGKLLDAELGSLTGFQAVNAALSMRDAQCTFNPLISMPASTSITSNERIVLKRFFGIDCAELQESYKDASVTEVDWEASPEPVVPLSEVEDVSSHRGFPFFVPRARPALFVTLLLILTAGAIALAMKVNERRKQAQVAQTTVVPSDETQQVAETTQQNQNQPQAGPHNITGEWTIVNTVQETRYRAFDDLKIGFRLVINQTGKEFTAKGEKVSENGRSLPAHDRTPIAVVGSIDGDQVVATFIEDGARRKTNGRFMWRLQSAGAELTGTFVSSAARSSGRSAATKSL